MTRFVPILGGIGAAALLVLAGLATTTREVPVHAVVTLSPAQDPPWHSAYCLPSGTMFTYSWATSDGTPVTLQITSPDTLGPGFVTIHASNGSGRLFAGGTELFDARNLTSESVQIVVELDFVLEVPTLSTERPPASPC